ncbi:uncharacterized protein LOC110813666 isoform X1 [Carica papaya]|uniref:uncharacterized protein LOC110813666 isoform X1 n=1 Tax=Carica papaya TaxID=3649 RepID=UPI000B8CCE54|nr:uncharacterized protein LOC110813666 isoform X1 [Carica papaya]
MPELTWRASSFINFMEPRASTQKRSNSYQFQRNFQKAKIDSVFETASFFKLEMEQLKGSVEAKKRLPQNGEAQDSLKKEISQLQERLHDEFAVRHALEKALSYRPLCHDSRNENSIPKEAKELIKEVALLELEVVYLEQYLLSLYRKNFDKTISMMSTIDERLKPNSVLDKGITQEVTDNDTLWKNDNSVSRSGLLKSPRRNSVSSSPKECNDSLGQQKLLDSGIHRSHSSLSQNAAHSFRMSPSSKAVAKAVDSYHSLPLSMLEQAQTDTSNGESLAMHLGTCISDHVPETPNWLSEEMVKCISTIYCELADPPLMNQDYLPSPVSCSSSMEMLSSQDQGDFRNQEWGNFSSFNSDFDHSFQNGDSKEFGGSYSLMAKVQGIQSESQETKDMKYKLRRYRSLVYRLEEVNPKIMKHEEKLAFWINVHNALVMHAFLVYGIPNNNLRRTSLILKAAYNVGGQTVNVDVIQSSILRCRMPRPGQWLRLLLPSKPKLKAGDARKAFAIQHPEPLLHFALCTGCYSDPALRIYTPTRIRQELEAARGEYIQSNISLSKDQKILLPKIVESFAKDSNLCIVGLLEMIEHDMPHSLKKKIQQSQHRKSGKAIEWIPHNFVFRYLLSEELA